MTGADGRAARELAADGLLDRAAQAVRAAQGFLLRAQHRDHWRGELESNTTITAEYVMLRQALGLDLRERREAIAGYLFGHQKDDGSWGIAWNFPGDVSTTVEAYLALRLLGLPALDPRLRRAEAFVRAAGGIAKVRVFTRINLALFGLFPWAAVPSVPPEVIFLPRLAPVNVYRLSSWARSTMVPLFIAFHHRPVFPLPQGAGSDWLDSLWLDRAHKHVPYREPALATLLHHGPGWKAFFNGADALLRAAEVVFRGPLRSVRRRALAACEAWTLAHQEVTGDFGGIFPPMLNGVLALHLQGYAKESDPVRRGLEAIEAFSILDGEGFRVEACQSPVWDTALAIVALLDAGLPREDPRLRSALHWIAERQILAERGDWKVYNLCGRPGGWSFEYCNTWYPDVDDTAAVLLAFLKQDPASHASEVVRRGAEWMVSMQNRDGGFAAFDVDNDRLFLNEIPFSDMDSLCDPSSPDVTGRVLEALGLLGHRRLSPPVRRALAYLQRAQEPEGSFFGRWGVNYVYGTAHVLNGLARVGLPASDEMVSRALAWLLAVQGDDGGFGEGLESYAQRDRMGVGPATASQTAWGVMGLLAYLPASHAAVRRGIRWLLDAQLESGPEAGSWEEREFTGTGFPRHFYLRYHLYRHNFPLTALGRFCAAAGARG